MDNLKVDIEVNGQLADETKMITVMLENVLIYEKIVFEAFLNMDTKNAYFERDERILKKVIFKEDQSTYDVELIFNLIETTKPLWYDVLKSKPDGYQGPDEPFSTIVEEQI